MDISKLVYQAKNNDESAISQLMGLVGQKAKYIALSYVKNDDIKADDIVQESYIRAFSNLSQLDNPKRFEAWFYRIVNNIGIDKTKLKLIDKNSSFATDLDYDEDNQFEFEDDSLQFNPKDGFDYEELKKGMQEFLDSLPLAQKEAVYMYYFENLNAREIAEEFNTTEDTVRSRLRYAKTKMKEKIEEMEKQGKSLRGIAPIPFLLWMLDSQVSTTIPAKLTSSSILVGIGAAPPVLTTKTISSAAGKAISSTSAKQALGTTSSLTTKVGTVKVAGVAMSTKALAATTAVVIGTGAVGTTIVVQHQNEVRQEQIINARESAKTIEIEEKKSDEITKTEKEEEEIVLEEPQEQQVKDYSIVMTSSDYGWQAAYGTGFQWEVNVPSLNIRSEPSSNSTSIGVLSQGQKFTGGNTVQTELNNELTEYGSPKSEYWVEYGGGYVCVSDKNYQKFMRFSSDGNRWFD